MEDSFLKTQVVSYIMVYGVNIVYALAIFVIGRWLAKSLKGIVGNTLTKRGTDPTLIPFVQNLTYYSLLTFVILAALAKVGIQTTSFIAVIGAAGLAVGLALQGSLSNFAAGVLLILFRPCKAGDYIEGGGVAGSVVGIGVFTTQLNTPDNKLIIIPNSKLMGDNIVNYSARDTRRIDMVFGVSYTDSLDKARMIINGVLESDERVLKDPAPTVGVLELADSSVNFAVRPWVNTPDYWPVYFDITEKMKKSFDEGNVSIPFPQRDVHMFEHKLEEIR